MLIAFLKQSPDLTLRRVPAPGRSPTLRSRSGIRRCSSAGRRASLPRRRSFGGWQRWSLCRPMPELPLAEIPAWMARMPFPAQEPPMMVLLLSRMPSRSDWIPGKGRCLWRRIANRMNRRLPSGERRRRPARRSKELPEKEKKAVSCPVTSLAFPDPADHIVDLVQRLLFFVDVL